MEKTLLHCCCAPCSVSCIQALRAEGMEPAVMGPKDGLSIVSSNAQGESIVALVIYQTEHENFDDMINFFSKLQAEGLVDPDWALNTEATLIEKFSSGRAIVAAASRGMVSNSAETLTATTEVTWDDIGYINALKGADGTCK